MNNKNKPVPHCLFCGAEMERQEAIDWRCASCGQDIVGGSYNAAMRRYKGTNHVLSLAELVVSAGTLVWIEDNNGDDEPCVHARMVTYWEGKSNRIYFDGGRTWYADYTYGETWRCWLRKPTPEEMANTPWEGNDA